VGEAAAGTPDSDRGCPPGGYALRFQDVSKAFGGTQALRRVSFGVGRGEVHALLGGNGSGKSTLIKVLAGVHQANEGWIEAAGQLSSARQTTPGGAHALGLRFVHQGVSTFADLSVAENFALGSSYGSTSLERVNWKELNARVRATLDRFDVSVSPATQMGELSAAQQTLVTIARALEDEEHSAILVLDEPTSALPAHEVGQVHQAIRGYVRQGHTVLIVSHRVDEVLAVATHATFLRDGQHLATRPVAGMDERTIVQLIAGTDHAPRSNSRRTTRPRIRLEVEGISVGRLENVSFVVREGEILGLSGLVGSGRSSLLRCLCGLRNRRAGRVMLDGEKLPGLRPDQAIRKGIAYIPEDRINDAAFPERPVRENLTAPGVKQFWSMGRLDQKAERLATWKAIDRYSIKASSSESVFAGLSGGNQQKIVIARWLELKPRLLLLDEPTQGVDVGARDVLHNLIRAAADAGASVIVASSDARELADLSDRVLGLSNGQISGELTGDGVNPRACVELAYGLEARRVGAPANTTDSAADGAPHANQPG
jgi:ribose transport system ATP-binding protein